MMEVEFEDSILVNKTDDHETHIIVTASGDVDKFGEVSNLHIEHIWSKDNSTTVNPKELQFRDIKRVMERAQDKLIEKSGEYTYVDEDIN